MTIYALLSVSILCPITTAHHCIQMWLLTLCKLLTHSLSHLELLAYCTNTVNFVGINVCYATAEKKRWQKPTFATELLARSSFLLTIHQHDVNMIEQILINDKLLYTSAILRHITTTYSKEMWQCFWIRHISVKDTLVNCICNDSPLQHSLNSHFPGQPGTRMSPFWILLEQRWWRWWWQLEL